MERRANNDPVHQRLAVTTGRSETFRWGPADLSQPTDRWLARFQDGHELTIGRSPHFDNGFEVDPRPLVDVVPTLRSESYAMGSIAPGQT